MHKRKGVARDQQLEKCLSVISKERDTRYGSGSSNPNKHYECIPDPEKCLCVELNHMMSSFWWGNKVKENKILWRSWEKMGMQKANGGLGFRDLECFDSAMIANQGWRMIKNTSSALICWRQNLEGVLLLSVGVCIMCWANWRRV